MTQAREVHEVGCGEGQLSIFLCKEGRRIRGSDFSSHVIEKARTSAREKKCDIEFKVSSIEDLQPERDAAPLIICCEVLEHLPGPEEALRKLVMLAKPYLLVSVPREPIWRCLNMVRGKYLSDFGNTPGHLQHWSSQSFLNFLSTQTKVLTFRKPLPWTMALCQAPCPI